MTDKELFEEIRHREGLKKAIIKTLSYLKEQKNGFIELTIKKGNVVDTQRKDRL